MQKRVMLWTLQGKGKGPAPGFCALVLGSSLAASLRRLLQNDSLMDIGSRAALYMELVQLLRKLGVLPSPLTLGIVFCSPWCPLLLLKGNSGSPRRLQMSAED